MRKILLWNVLLSLCLGCGTGHYEELVGNRKSTPASDSLGAEQTLEGTKISIRVPSKLGSPLAGAEDGRMKPGIITISDLKQTYETSLKDSAGGEQTCYCYVGATDAKLTPLEKIAGDIRAQLTACPDPKTVGNWMDYQGKAPDGRPIAWRQLRFTGVQPLYYRDKDGKGKLQDMEGMLDVYLHEEAGTVVIVAWRMSTKLESAIGLGEMAAAVAGSVSAKP